VDRYQWLLFLHVTGAFLLIGGAVVAAVLNFAALRGGRRPSEVALLFGLVRIAVVAIVSGSLLTLVFGLWLVEEAPWGYGYGDGWIVAAIVLWVLGNAAGNLGGRRDEKTTKLARRLASEGDTPSAELQARVRDPVSLALSYGSGLIMLAVLGLMMWKPGA
jgi:uncharacterized membrane protein